MSKFYNALQAMKNGYVVRCGNSLYEMRDGIIFKDGFPHELTADEMSMERTTTFHFMKRNERILLHDSGC